MHEKSNFVDILEPRRTQSGIFRFMTRDWHPKKTQILSKKYTPQDLKDITARSLYLENAIEAESAKTGVSKEKLKQEILEYIEEIGLDKKMYVIRWLGMFALKVAFNMNVGIYVNEPALLKIKSAMGKNPVLFLPTHRSYADFCILTYLCYHYDIEFPAVASGMDFYSMAVMGRVLRDTCAFYIRRTLSGSALYADTLRQYVRTLVARHDAPIEFFLEGTRSRSNKTLPPKFGMLSMALGPLLSGSVTEVTLVPVHVAYDRLMEHAAFAYHHLGVPKPRESTRGLLKWVSSLNEQFGNMYINFGSPLSGRELLRLPRGARTAEALKPPDLQELTPDQFAQIRSVASRVVSGQQQAALLTCSHLLALVITQAFILRTAPSRERVLDSLRCYTRMLSDLGAQIWEGKGEEQELDRALVVHAQSWAFDHQRRLRLLLPPHASLAAQRRHLPALSL
ncbi:unnamed protein product [Chilo suppressalis]|uniref:Phospholipid/glycerol acyltransferase domain-containing protein n=1 Tax=Chilo suppressalis TaxID=168631 RepID=A0ABN8B2P0_CHISP|nr:unnamed protein product [Chilo suppressalis]